MTKKKQLPYFERHWYRAQKTAT